MHIAKYNRSAVGHILAHNEPGKARANRENIDSTLTQYNYNFIQGKGIDNLQKVLAQVHTSKRKDLNILCSCVISAPDDLPKDREQEFFYNACVFLTNRYNCIPVSAWVHLDEPNAKSHLHFDFCPVVYDKKKDRLKVCAKDIINKKDLMTLHQDFFLYIKKTMGLELSILNGETSKGNLSVLELKRRTLEQDIKRLKDYKADLINQIEYELTR